MNESSNRETILRRELARYIAILAGDQAVVGAVVFGSLAHGPIREYSDIDLLVVRESGQPFFRRLRQLRRALEPRVGTDLLVYTPDELEQMKGDRPFVRDEVLKRGRVVYERERGEMAELCA